MSDASDGPDEIDLDALDIGPMLRHARTATFAPNWLSVIAADAFGGMLIVISGVLLTLWIKWIGWPVVAIGVVYLFLVMRRFLQWRWLRGKAGL